MREHVIWNGDNFDEVSNFVTSGVKYSESTRITNGEKKENKLLFILDEDSNWVPVDEGSYIWKNDNGTFYITTELPGKECDYENDDTGEEEPDCENCEFKDNCEDYDPENDFGLDDDNDEDYAYEDGDYDEDDDEDYDEDYDEDEDENPDYDYTEAQQKRIDFLTKEIEELKGKITKIDNLMGSYRWTDLSDVRKTMLQAQLQAMRNYCFWLDKRLNWEKNLGE